MLLIQGAVPIHHRFFGYLEETGAYSYPRDFNQEPDLSRHLTQIFWPLV